jgi:hypothetical protein
MDKTATEEVEFTKVNKYHSDWDAKAIFSGYNLKVTLKHQDSFITQLNNTNKIKQKFTKDLGEEGGRWYCKKDDFYLTDSIVLLQWKMYSIEDFNSWFGTVEQHTEDEEAILRQEEEKELRVKEAKERAEFLKRAKEEDKDK